MMFLLKLRMTNPTYTTYPAFLKEFTAKVFMQFKWGGRCPQAADVLSKADVGERSHGVARPELCICSIGRTIQLKIKIAREKKRSHRMVIAWGW
jgi:hypothetical protein